MGKDKLRRFEENKTFSNLFQADFCDVAQEDYALKGKWASHVFKNDRPIILELGCGKGEYTLALARRNPSLNYMGVDIKGARLWRGAKTALNESLPNVAFLRTRIELIDRFFAPNEIAEIWITFPDPQPKRENKRLTCPRFLERYLTFLQPSALIHLKTDSRELHDYTVETAQTLPQFRLEFANPDIYKEGPLPESDILSVQTFYEAQFRAQGKPITYLRMVVTGK